MHGDRRPLGEQRELAAARLDLAAGFAQLDQLLLEALVEAAVVLGEPAVGVAQAVAGVEDAVEAVGDGHAHGVEERAPAGRCR